MVMAVRSPLFNCTISTTDFYIMQKRKEREAAILKNTRLTEDQRKKWLGVVRNEYMSLEESGTDDTITIHRPQWRSEYVNKMFDRIDAYCTDGKSPQARRQMKKRAIGSHSSRSQPSDAPEWAIRK